MNILYLVLCEISKEDTASQSVVNYALKYCNKFLEQYNNDKVLEIKNILTEKTHQFEVDK